MIFRRVRKIHRRMIDRLFNRSVFNLRILRNKYVGDATGRLLQSTFRMTYIVALIPLMVIYLPIAFRHFRKWNGGICGKCGSGKWELLDYDSDRINKNIYSCKNCSCKFKTPLEFDELSDSDAKMISRDNKLKELGI